jgi:hypothetical protein
MLRRRELLVPSLRGLLVLGLAAAGLAWLCLVRVHGFLAMEKPLPGEVLVVEGWIPDYALREALAEFRSHPYRLLITTGGPLPQGTVFSEYGNYARYAAHILGEWGLPGDSLRVVPTPEAGRDRTFQEAVALREWFIADGNRYASLDLFSFSTHARRSRMLYGMAFGKAMPMGVYAARDIGYDPAAWWRTSNGVRRITDETVAYLYAKLCFRAPAPAEPEAP